MPWTVACTMLETKLPAGILLPCDEDADIQIGQLPACAQLPFPFQHFPGEAPAIKTAFHAIETRQFRQDPLERHLCLDMLYEARQPSDSSARSLFEA